MSGTDPVHSPVLIEEALGLMEPPEDEALMVDANLGEGGHAEAFLERYPLLSVIGIDADAELVDFASSRLRRFGRRFHAFEAWSDEFFENYDRDGEQRPDRVFFDLGVSAFHYERAARGFSFAKDEPLDMRLGRGSTVTARQIVNSYNETKLADILYEYGEERYSRRIARRIVEERRKDPIVSSGQLARTIWRAVPAPYRRGRIHPATKSFQALRIVVNDELARLEGALAASFEILETKGRIGVIAFHSLEDRIVKRFFGGLARSCTCPPDWPVCRCGGQAKARVLTKRPIRPSDDEVLRNPACRSAKFRVAEKVV
jgi:16S rRNA (cytosine1402-N4)-methyltransferase